MSVYIYSVFVNIVMTTPRCRAVRCLLSSMLEVYSFCNLLLPFVSAALCCADYSI